MFLPFVTNYKHRKKNSTNERIATYWYMYSHMRRENSLRDFSFFRQCLCELTSQEVSSLIVEITRQLPCATCSVILQITRPRFPSLCHATESLTWNRIRGRAASLSRALTNYTILPIKFVSKQVSRVKVTN